MDAKATAAVKPALETGRQEQRRAQRPSMKLTQQQLEAHLWGAANILRGKTAGQDYKNYILSLMFYKRLCDQWENEADEAIAELERQQGRTFSDAQKEVLTQAMRAVSNANEELRGVFTVDWAQPAPDGSGKSLIPNDGLHEGRVGPPPIDPIPQPLRDFWPEIKVSDDVHHHVEAVERH